MKLAFYLRLSRSDGTDGESNSIRNQRKLLENYTKENLDDRPYTEYVDDGYSGANTDRPSFQRLISDCRMGIVDTILVKDLSRFGRDYVAVNDYVEQIFPMLGVRFISVLDHFDSSKSQDGTLDMCPAVMNIVNTYYVYDFSQKIKASRTAMMRRGILTTKFTPLGYRCDDRDEGWIIEEKEAKLVRRIFDLALEGKSTGDIARILNSEHIPTPMKLTGHGYSETFDKYILWEPNNVGSILRNEAYTGVLIQRKTKALIPGKKIIRRTSADEQFRHDGHHEGIVSVEEWEKAQKAIQPKQETTKRSSIEWALKGKVRCGICNRSMGKARETSNRIACMRPGCTNAINVEDLNSAAMQPILRKRRRTLEQLKAMDNIDTKAEESCIAELRRVQADEYEGYINGDLDGEEFRQRKERIRAEIEGLEQTIREKKQNILHSEEKKKRMQWFLDHSKGNMTQQMADEIIDRVIVGEDGVTVLFREGL